jgi:ribonucleoside-diphosphate reductase beta chain
VKNYIRYIGDRRLAAASTSSQSLEYEKNPLPWMDEMLNGAEHTNFFENRATEYSKASTARHVGKKCLKKASSPEAMERR